MLSQPFAKPTKPYAGDGRLGRLIRTEFKDAEARCRRRPWSLATYEITRDCDRRVDWLSAFIECCAFDREVSCVKTRRVWRYGQNASKKEKADFCAAWLDYEFKLLLWRAKKAWREADRKRLRLARLVKEKAS